MPRLLIFLFLSLFAGSAAAQDFVGARAMGMAEAYRAVATGNDAIYFNPAGLVLIPRFSPELHYKLNLFNETHLADFSFVDSKTTVLAAGLAYTFEGSELSRRTTKHKATMAIAYSFFPDVFSMGLSIKYVNITDIIIGNYLNGVSGDLGAMVIIPGGVQIAAVGYNLIPFNSTDLPISAGFALAWDLGPLAAAVFGGKPAVGRVMDPSGVSRKAKAGEAKSALSNLTVTTDWFLNFYTLEGYKSRVSTGMEYLAFDMIPIRTGYMWDEELADHTLTVGTGFIVPYFGFDIGFQQSVIDVKRQKFAFSLKFFIDM